MEGKYENALAGLSAAPAGNEIGRANATAGVKLVSNPSRSSATSAIDVPSKAMSRDIGHVYGQSSEASSPPAYSNSPAASPSPIFPGLMKSNSTASAGGFSTGSHVSVPVTGTLPYGSLYVHHPVDSPQTANAAESRTQDPTVEPATPSPPRPKCLDSGDIFLILDLPEKFTVGLDTVALTAQATRFLGFRDIPAGPHFLWISEPNALTRCGYWFITEEKGGDIRVKQWDRYNEVLGEVASQFELREQKDNIESLYPRLMPYQYEKNPSGKNGQAVPPPDDLLRHMSDPGPPPAADGVSIWPELTSSISRDLLSRVTGKTKVAEWLLDTTDTARGELHFPQQPNKSLRTVVGGAELNFLFAPDAVDLQLLNLTTTPDYSADTSAQILAVLESPSAGLSDADIVGELQFAFLVGMYLGNASCLEHWWHLVLKVILRAHHLVVSRPALCRALLATFLAQMVYNDRHMGRGGAGGGDSILEVMPHYKDRLREALTIYKRRLNEALLGLNGQITQEQGAVGHTFVDLEAWFWKYGWDLRSDYVRERLEGAADSDEDYAPVVVELDADGREVGLVSL